MGSVPDLDTNRTLVVVKLDISNLIHSIRNIIYKIIIISGSLYLPPHILVPPPHELTILGHLLRSREKLIDELVGYVHRNGGLPPLNVLIYGP